MLDLTNFNALLSPPGQQVLAEATALQPTEATLLGVHRRLRKQFPEDFVRAALETVILRNRAVAKFSRAQHMYFTREALEQSSSEVVSSYRARRFAPFRTVGDFCCGIGGDAIGLSANSAVTAFDIDPLRLAMAEQNLHTYDRHATFTAADVLTTRLPALDAVFIDPDRRSGGKRHVRISEYTPDLAAVRAGLPKNIALGAKVAPAAPWSELATFDAEIEFISLAGELKECVLWFGPLKTEARRATLLPSGDSLCAAQPAAQAEPVMPRTYLYDPDPAVTRSSLVANLAEQIDALPIASDIAYLTSNTLSKTPFARAYLIEHSLPFHSKRIAEYLKARNVGHATIMKRGSAVDVNELLRRWKLRGTESRTVILTRVMDQPWALIGSPV